MRWGEIVRLETGFARPGTIRVEHQLYELDSGELIRCPPNATRRELRKRRILPVISRKGAPNIKGLGKLRYVVEQTFALLHQFKRLAVRWERRTDLHDAFVSLACSLICRRRLKKARP